jgi:hypothetical protein
MDKLKTSSPNGPAASHRDLFFVLFEGPLSEVGILGFIFAFLGPWPFSVDLSVCFSCSLFSFRFPGPWPFSEGDSESPQWDLSRF